MSFLLLKKLFFCLALLFCIDFIGCANISKMDPKSQDLQKQDIDSKKVNEVSFSIIKKNGKNIDFETFIDEILKYDIVIIGEDHYTLSHHLAEAKIINALLDHKKKINVVYEMISTDKQDVLDKAKDRQKSGKSVSKNELKKLLNWDEAWDYNMYKYPIEATFYSDSGLYGGNLSRSEINMFFTQNIEPIKGKISAQKEVKARLKELIAKAHGFRNVRDGDSKTNTSSTDASNLDSSLDILVEIQQYKDRRMADVLVHTSGGGVGSGATANLDGSGVKDSKDSESSKDIKDSGLKDSRISVLIAGKYHAFKTIGVPLHIIDYKKNKKVAVVILDAESKVKTDSKEYDYLISM